MNIAWSYSRIKAFEQCPRKHWHESKHLGNKIPFEETDAMRSGTETHKAFELFFKRKQELPIHLMHWTPTLTQIAAAPGEKMVEQQIALNINWQPVEWYAKDAWLRVKSDLTQINRPAAICWDWKTGKQDDDWTQLELNCAVTHILDPRITEFTMAYGWLKDKAFPMRRMPASSFPDFWAKMLPRVAKYQEACDKQDFPPKPNFLCKKYCAVKSCQYNGV